MKIVSVVGRKNSGKTSLTVKIIQELKSRGYSVSSIKHSHHQLNMDKENTDTWRHKQAGSQTVVGVGATTHFNITKDLDLERLLFLIKVIEPVDFVVIEGFKSYNYPKIATTEDVVDEDTIKLVDSFTITDEGLKELVDEIELHSHDIIDTIYADNCGFNNPKEISKNIIDGNLTAEGIDQIDTYLSVNDKVIGLNKFVNNYLRETTVGMIKALNLKQFGIISEIENVQLLIQENADKEINGENKQIKLLLNNINIGLNEFTQTFMINTIFSMINSLKINQDEINSLNLKISEDANSLTVNDEKIEINEFVKKILKETVNGMIKSLKTKEYGVDEIKDIEIAIE